MTYILLKILLVLAQALIIKSDSAILRCVILASMADIIWIGGITIGNPVVCHPQSLNTLRVKHLAIDDNELRVKATEAYFL